MWDIEETALRRKHVLTEQDKSYLLKVRNPVKSFTMELRREVNWSKEFGTLTLEEVETPRTVLCYVRRNNRTNLNVRGKTYQDSERTHAAAQSLANQSNVSLMVRVPQGSESIVNFMISSMYTTAA